MLDPNISKSQPIWEYHADKNAISKKRQKKNSKEIETVRYELGKYLNGGDSADIYQLVPPPGRKIKAIKQIYYKETNHSLNKEYKISQIWDNKSIGLLIRPKAYFSIENTGKPDIIVMHLYDGCLSDEIDKMSILEKLEAICQISQGLTTLHSLGITHNDLNLRNVLFDKKLCRYDLADFETARYLGKDNIAQCNFLFKNDVKKLISLIKQIIFPENMADKSLEKEQLLDSSLEGKLVDKIFNFFQNPPENANEIYDYFNSIRTYHLDRMKRLG